MLKKMQQLTRTKDAIIIGPRTTGFIPDKYGFNCIHGARNHAALNTNPRVLTAEDLLKEFSPDNLTTERPNSDNFHSVYVKRSEGHMGEHKKTT